MHSDAMVMDEVDVEASQDAPGAVEDLTPGAAGRPPALESLDPGVVHLWRLHSGVRALFLTGVAALIAGYVGDGVRSGAVVGLAALVLLGAHAFVWPALRYRNWGYSIRTDDVFLRYGVLWKVTSVIPHRRLQHVDTERGPFERWLGLSRVVIYTAGNRGAESTVPGLAREAADSLRDRLGRLGQGDDAV